MASPFVPFDCFALDLGKGVHNFSTDTLKIYLTNIAPNKATMVKAADLPGLATGGGYTAGGISIGPLTWAQVSGLASLLPGQDAVYTATTGFGPFRYAVLYNDTAATDPLIAYWDNGVSISIAATKDFTVDLASTVLTNQFQSA